MQEQPRLISPIIQYMTGQNMVRDYTSLSCDMSELVILPLGTLNYQQPQYFASNNMLDGDNCTITCIDLVTSSELATLPGNYANITTRATYDYGVLYMSNLKRQVFAELPLNMLCPTNNNCKPCLTWFTEQVWQNCYVQFTTSGSFTGQALALQVYYRRKEKE